MYIKQTTKTFIFLNGRPQILEKQTNKRIDHLETKQHLFLVDEKVMS